MNFCTKITLVTTSQRDKISCTETLKLQFGINIANPNHLALWKDLKLHSD